MNRYTNNRPDTRHLGSEYQTAASYLRRGSKLAVGTADRDAPSHAGPAEDGVQQTSGDAASKKIDPQHGNAEASPPKQR